MWAPDSLAQAATSAGFRVDDINPGLYTELWATRDRTGS